MMFFIYSYLFLGCVFTLLVAGGTAAQREQQSEKEKKKTRESRSNAAQLFIIIHYAALPITWFPTCIYYLGWFIEEEKGG